MHEFDTSYGSFDTMNHAMDFGFNHATALLTCGFKNGEIYVCNEIYVNEMDTNDIISLAARRGIDKRLRMYCDSANPDLIQIWKRAGYLAGAVVKNPGSVNAQIDILKKMKIHIHPSCTNTIREIQQWKWKKDKKTNIYIDEPVNLNDDAMAALRYAIEPLRQQRCPQMWWL